MRLPTKASQNSALLGEAASRGQVNSEAALRAVEEACGCGTRCHWTGAAAPRKEGWKAPGLRSARGPVSTESAPAQSGRGVCTLIPQSRGQTPAPSVVSDRAFQPKELGFLGLMAGSRAGQGEHRMSPEHPSCQTVRKWQNEAGHQDTGANSEEQGQNG